MLNSEVFDDAGFVHKFAIANVALEEFGIARSDEIFNTIPTECTDLLHVRSTGVSISKELVAIFAIVRVRSFYFLFSVQLVVIDEMFE